MGVLGRKGSGSGDVSGGFLVFFLFISFVVRFLVFFFKGFLVFFLFLVYVGFPRVWVCELRVLI